jgi:acetyl-CoA carboxylase biotin carboxyl carrier protein
MRIEEIKAIVELMKENALTEFELEENGVRLLIRKGTAAHQIVQQTTQPVPAQSVVSAPPYVEKAMQAASTAQTMDDSKFVKVKAPFVGTFYRAPAPDAAPYVTVGQEVGPDTVLCILEAMKVMNEIKAEVSGIIREVLVENAHAVQYGQPLFKIEKK